MVADWKPILLRDYRREEARPLAYYAEHGGYEGLRRALAMSPERVAQEVAVSGLIGRGGAGFPTGRKWQFVPQESPKPRYLVCNFDESEPGTFKDRALGEYSPHLVLEGILIASHAIGCRHAYIYIRGEYTRTATILERAIEEARAAGLLNGDVSRWRIGAGGNVGDAPGSRPAPPPASNAPGPGAPGGGGEVDVTIHRGAGAYICGEETALLSSLEGGRGYPRIRPPFPAIEGAWKCPTVVQNVETLSCLPHILAHGGKAFASIGPASSPGPKVYCVSGDVVRPGLFEFPMTVTLRELIELSGGVVDGLKVKAVIPGGSSMPVLRFDKPYAGPDGRERTESLDLQMDFESVRKAGSMLGSAGVMVMHERRCMVAVLHNLARFYHHESCSQCTPCREGTGWVEKILARILAGRGRPDDIPLLLDVASKMSGTTICVLSDSLAMPVHSFVTRFRDEFEHFCKNGRSMVADAVPI